MQLRVSQTPAAINEITMLFIIGEIGLSKKTIQVVVDYRHPPNETYKRPTVDMAIKVRDNATHC